MDAVAEALVAAGMPLAEWGKMGLKGLAPPSSKTSINRSLHFQHASDQTLISSLEPEM